MSTKRQQRKAVPIRWAPFLLSRDTRILHFLQSTQHRSMYRGQMAMELNTGIQINISTLLRRQRSTKSARPRLSSAMEAAVVIPFLSASTTWKQKTQQKNVKTLLATELNGHVKSTATIGVLMEVALDIPWFFFCTFLSAGGECLRYIALLNNAKGSFPTVPHCLKLTISWLLNKDLWNQQHATRTCTPHVPTELQLMTAM